MGVTIRARVDKGSSVHTQEGISYDKIGSSDHTSCGYDWNCNGSTRVWSKFEELYDARRALHLQVRLSEAASCVGGGLFHSWSWGAAKDLCARL